MPKIDLSERYTRKELEDDEALPLELDRSFEKHAEAINLKPDRVIRQVDPVAGDYLFEDGTIWINQTGANIFILLKHPTATTATWTAI